MMETGTAPHILHLTTQKGWRGGEQQIAYLTEELAQKRIKQLVACPEGSDMAAHCLRQNLPFVSFPATGSFSFRMPFFLRRLGGQYGITLVHAHDSHALNHALMAYRLGLKRPIVVNRRVDFPVRSRFKYNHAAVKKIICDSDAIHRVMGECLGHVEKLVTIHSGIDVLRFSGRTRQGRLRQEFGYGPGVFLVGNVAALADHKDYPTFVQTAELLLKHDDRFRFLIIGDGPERSAIDALITRKKLQNRIRITGFRSDVPEILPDLDLFLITSKTEGLGTSIIEAMAAGVPVVATAAGGIPELVVDGVTGMLAPVKDSQSLCDAVLRIQCDAGLKEKILSGATLIPPRFDKHEIADRTWDVYRDILDERGGK